jgi:hypothetical protein
MKSASFYIFSLGLALMVGDLVSCGGPKQITGTYKVTGSPGAVANITYAPSGLDGNSVAINQTLPWQTQFTAYESEGSYQGTYVYLSALNDALVSSSSSITITVLEDNSVYQQPDYETGGGNAVTIIGNF